MKYLDDVPIYLILIIVIATISAVVLVINYNRSHGSIDRKKAFIFSLLVLGTLMAFAALLGFMNR